MFFLFLKARCITKIRHKNSYAYTRYLDITPSITSYVSISTPMRPIDDGISNIITPASTDILPIVTDWFFVSLLEFFAINKAIPKNKTSITTDTPHKKSIKTGSAVAHWIKSNTSQTQNKPIIARNNLDFLDLFL